MGNEAVDYDTDIQTIGEYAQAVADVQAKIAFAYTTALANVETTFQQASPEEARPDVVGVMLKSGVKAIEKIAVTAVKTQTGADLGPVVEMVHAIGSELDRAQQAGASQAAGEWIRGFRTSVANAYTQGQGAAALREKLIADYNQGDEGQRAWTIGGVQNELAAVKTINPPRTENIEVAMYEAWINQFFDSDCMNGNGSVILQFNGDGALETCRVNAPLGSRVAGAMNGIMVAAGVERIMDLQVVKKVCRVDSCMCFEPNGVVRKGTDDAEAESFLSSSDTWTLARRFDA